MSTGTTLMKYWPIVVLAAGAIASASVDTFRIGANAEEIDVNNLLIEANEEDIEEIRRELLIRQGQIELDL